MASDSRRTLRLNCKIPNENRKVPKPLIEKKRRARINKCLTELKTLMGDLISQVPNRKSGKLEKADILEVTVKHLREIKSKKPDEGMFRKGFENCLGEVKIFLENNDNERFLGPSIVGRLERSLESLSTSPSATCSVIRHTNESWTQSMDPLIEVQIKVKSSDRSASCPSPGGLNRRQDDHNIWRPW